MLCKIATKRRLCQWKLAPYTFDLIFVPRYIYTNQYSLATVQFGMISLSLCIFSLGLSVGVVIAVGMLLFFQVD